MEHPAGTTGWAERVGSLTPASVFEVGKIPPRSGALSCCLDLGGTVVSAVLAMFKRAVGGEELSSRGSSSSYPPQTSVPPFSLYLVPGHLSRDLGQSAVI